MKICNGVNTDKKSKHLNLFASFWFVQESVESAVPSLVALDSSMAGFARDLEILDNTNNRTVDTAHVFYVQAGQTSPLDILSNVVRHDFFK